MYKSEYEQRLAMKEVGNKAVSLRIATDNDLPLLLQWGKEMYEAERKYMPLLTFSMDEAQIRYTRELHEPSSHLAAIFSLM